MTVAVVGGFIAMDCITGIIKAVKNKAFSSSIMREGSFHKLGSLFAIVLGFFADYAQVVIDLGYSVPIAIPICVYIATMEIGSIIENISAINPQIIPSKLSQFFSKINKGGEN